MVRICFISCKLALYPYTSFSARPVFSVRVVLARLSSVSINAHSFFFNLLETCMKIHACTLHACFKLESSGTVGI